MAAVPIPTTSWVKSLIKSRRLLILAACFFLAFHANSGGQEAASSLIETIAGGEPASVRGTEFSFGSVSGLATDSSGNVYFTIQSLNRVYRLDADGQVTVFAGNGVRGQHHDGLPAVDSPLMNPAAIAIDAEGNLLIACWNAPAWNALLRVDAASGLLSTVFTTPVPYGHPDSPNSIYGAEDIAVGPDGALYIIDGARIKSYSPSTGAVTVIAGNGTQKTAQLGIPAVSSPLNHPRSLAVAPDGTVYFTALEPDIFHVRQDGKLETVSVAVSGAPPTCSYTVPAYISFDASGHLFASQPNCSRVLQITLKSGHVSVYAGTGSQHFNGDDIKALDAAVVLPSYLISDAAGNLTIAEQYRIRRVEASSQTVSTIVGNGLPATEDAASAASHARLWEPAYAVPASDGSVYITSSYSQRLLRASNGGLSSVAGGGDYALVGKRDGPASQVALDYPQGIWLDDNGDVYFSDSSSILVRRLDAQSGLVSTIATTPVTSKSVGGLLNYSGALVADGQYFYLAAPYAYCVWRISRSDGAFEVYAGIPSGPSNPPKEDVRPPERGRLALPSGLALDASRNLYITDGYFGGRQGRILRVDFADGRVTTILSNLRQPSGLAFQSPSVLCFAESSANQVRCLDLADHSVRVVAGTGTAGSRGDGGPAECGQLNRPTGISFDQSGNLYIADTGNQRVRRVRLSSHPSKCHDSSQAAK